MPSTRRFWICCVLLAAMLLPAWAAGAQRSGGKGEYLVYIGTYTRENSKGIYAYRFNAASGAVTPIGLVAETASPSFLAVHPNHRFLYAANEVASHEGKPGGAVSAFAIDRKSGKLTLLNGVSSGGAGPCHVAVDRSGKNVLVANYGAGSIAVLPVEPDGRLRQASAQVQHSGSGANPKRQAGPHAHWINVSPDNRFVLAVDLGLDQVLVYRFDPQKGSLAPNSPAFAKVQPGAGPRHFAFHPSGKFGYVINEIGSTVTAFNYDRERGALEEIQTVSTLPKDFSGDNSTAEIEVHPSGRFLYGSNRGHHSIAVFAIDAGKGTLTPLEHVSTQGRTPRNFAIDPSGAYLFAANQQSDNIAVFRIDAKSGRLAPTGQALQAFIPVCVTFVPAE